MAENKTQKTDLDVTTFINGKGKMDLNY